MPLTPADVHNVVFKKPPIGKRGYDEDEVDAFLDVVEAELARLIEENNELRASGGPSAPRGGGGPAPPGPHPARPAAGRPGSSAAAGPGAARGRQRPRVPDAGPRHRDRRPVRRRGQGPGRAD